MKIGFVGTGNMAAAMIPNLVRAGHEVHAWNRTPGIVERLEGVAVLQSARDAFQCDVVVTMLADDSAIRSVIVDSGILDSAQKNCVHVVMATISPRLVADLQAAHASRRLRYVAAPVFGVPAVAAKAELNIVAAGPPDAFNIVQPLFDAIGRTTWRLGEDQTHAAIAKIAGNMMITLAIEAMGEAAALTESYGLKAGDFLEILTSTLFASPSYKRYGANIAAESYDPGFKLSLGLKDVNLALDAADDRNVGLPSVAIVRLGLLEAVQRGWGARDWSMLAKVARERSIPDGSPPLG